MRFYLRLVPFILWQYVLLRAFIGVSSGNLGELRSQNAGCATLRFRSERWNCSQPGHYLISIWRQRPVSSFIPKTPLALALSD
jgi:hypothetical protein